MREILFRGKTEYGNWLYGNFLKCKQWKKDLKDSTFIALVLAKPPESIGGDEVVIKTEVIPETVGQYTGLTDKNGTKIFEGDIVRYPDSAFYAEYEDGYNEGFVDWCEETMCFYFTNRWSVEMEDFDVVDGKIMGVEVIGNIHDNPELLKGGAE